MYLSKVNYTCLVSVEYFIWKQKMLQGDKTVFTTLDGVFFLVHTVLHNY